MEVPGEFLVFLCINVLNIVENLAVATNKWLVDKCFENVNIFAVNWKPVPKIDGIIRIRTMGMLHLSIFCAELIFFAV